MHSLRILLHAFNLGVARLRWPGGSFIAKMLCWLALVGAAFAGPSNLVQTVTYNGETITLRLTRQNLRGAYFELWSQNTDGTYTVVTPVEERAYLGTVDEYPDAMSSGILQDDGVFRGNVDFNRGGSWLTLGTNVLYTRGTSQPLTFGYPGWTTTPGQAGTNLYGFDVGVDADYDYYSVRGGANVAKTFELIEFSVAATRAMYVQDALLRPYLGRVIIRASQTHDPANGLTGGTYLDAVRTEWNNNQTSANRDVVAGVSTSDVGGGLAWVGVIGTVSAYSVSDSDSDGNFSQVWRHEMGHNWGLSHYDGGGPEGSTINSGNQYARMSGPELANALNHRNSKLGIFNNEGVYKAVNIPPYAAIDGRSFVQTVTGPLTIDVKANDHDANGDSLGLLSFDATTAKGGTVSQVGQSLVYTPRGNFWGTDSFTYTIQDSSGQKASGAVAVDVDLANVARGIWAFDETTGTIADDQSFFGNNGTLNTTTFNTNSVPGRFGGNALQFDGVDDSVTMGTGPSLSGQSDLTVAAWIKTSSATEQLIIQQRDMQYGGAGYNGQYRFSVNANGTLRFFVYGNGAFQFDFSTTATVNDGNWHHVVAMRNGTAGRIYIGGNPTPAASASGTVRDLDANISVAVGRDIRDNIAPFNGVIDDVRLYDYALGSAAITTLSQGGGAAAPNPFHGATQVQLGSLGWAPGAAAIANGVYIGTSQAAVAAANTGSPEYQGSTTTNAWVFNPLPNTTYYWRIDTVTASTTVAGEVWNFTTGNEIFDVALVGLWRLDDGSGLTAADASPNGNNGTLFGGPTWAAGQLSGALQFDGADDHVVFDLGPSLSGPTDFTVSAWIKTTSATDQVILQQRDWRGYNGEYQLLVKANGTVSFWLYGNSAYQFDFSTTGTVNDGQWHFVSAVRAGTTGYIYIDGNPAPSASGSGTVRDLSSGIGVVMGRDTRDGIRNFNGLIDDARLYKRALSGTELTDLYNGNTPPPSTPTGLTATPGNNQVALSWNASSGATSYNVKRSTTSGGAYTTIASPTGTSYTDTTAVNGTTYYYVVSAVNAAGESANSTEVSATPTAPVPSFVATGSIASGTATITPALPAGLASGDILLLFVETANQAISVSNPNGGTWAAVTSSPQGTGTAGATSATRLTAYWSRYNGTQGAPTLSDSGDHQIAQIIAIRGAAASGNPWNVTAGGVEATAVTSASIPGATTTVANTLVVLGVAGSLPDVNGTSNFSGWSNAGLANLTERVDNTRSSGNGGALGIATGEKATAGAFGNTSATHASSAVKGMISIAIKN